LLSLWPSLEGWDHLILAFPLVHHLFGKPFEKDAKDGGQ